MVIVTWPLGQISSACKADTLSWRQGPSLKKIIWYFLIVDKIFQGMKSATHLFILINSCSLDFHFSRTVFSNKGSILAIQLAKEKSQNIESPGMQSAEFCLWIWLDSRLLQAHMDQKCHWAGGQASPKLFKGEVGSLNILQPAGPLRALLGLPAVVVGPTGPSHSSASRRLHQPAEC